MNEEIAVTVLAGGDGSRIGGSKPLRELAGRRLIDRALDLARSYSKQVAISVRDRDALCGVANLIEDDPAEGPLGGLIAGLCFARGLRAPLLLVIPIDTPFLPQDLGARLARAIGPRGCAIASSGGRIHPACSLWRVQSLDELPAYLATGRCSLHGLADWVGRTTVEWPGGGIDPFFNINTPEDLAQAELRLAAAG